MDSSFIISGPGSLLTVICDGSRSVEFAGLEKNQMLKQSSIKRFSICSTRRDPLLEKLLNALYKAILIVKNENIQLYPNPIGNFTKYKENTRAKLIMVIFYLDRNINIHGVPKKCNMCKLE